MNSHTTQRFRNARDGLPKAIQEQADRAYELFRDNPEHPSLRFKQVHADKAVYSVRVGGGYRALGVRDEEDMIWFWIGSHADYDRLLKNL